MTITLLIRWWPLIHGTIKSISTDVTPDPEPTVVTRLPFDHGLCSFTGPFTIVKKRRKRRRKKERATKKTILVTDGEPKVKRLVRKC